MTAPVKKSNPTMYFIGVSTANSLIMRIFPAWVEELGRPEVKLEGLDLALNDRAENYRAAVAQIKHDPNSIGALVTTHKISLFEAARDMFDDIDPYAVTCGEVSCISKNGSALEGHAKDPISAGKTLDSMLGESYFSNGGEVLCLGAGGAARAIVLHFAKKSNPGGQPRRIAVVDCFADRLEKLRAIADSVKNDLAIDYHHHLRPEDNDALMAHLPAGSVVINATGMGKDLPGSPLSDNGRFPAGGVAWELNYRGELRFFYLAHEQSESRNLRVEDGWLYFLYGWTEVIAQVLHIPIEGARFEKLAAIAYAIAGPRLVQSSRSSANARLGMRRESCGERTP